MQQRTPATARGVDAGSVDIIDILEQDHQTIKNLLAELNTAPKATRGEVLESLKRTLAVHCATEENVVYPALHELAKRPIHATKLYHQQDEAKVLVWALDQLSPEDDEFAKKAAKLRDAVVAHIDLEENDEFPHLRESAGDAMAELTAAAWDVRDEFTFGAEAGGARRTA
jgi:hemerythrin superfamily protein